MSTLLGFHGYGVVGRYSSSDDDMAPYGITWMSVGCDWDGESDDCGEGVPGGWVGLADGDG